MLPGGAVAAPRTIVESKYRITEVAQDAGRIAWIVARPRPACATIYGRRLNARRSVVLRTGRCSVWADGLQLGGGQAAWYDYYEGGRHRWWSIRTSALANPEVRVLHRGLYRGRVDGDASSLSGDGGTLAYGWKEVTASCNPYSTDGCNPDFTVTGGDARRIVGSRVVRIPGIGPTDALKTSGDRVAVAVEGGIEVRHAVTGNLVSLIESTDPYPSYALSRTTLALKTARPDGADTWQIEVYNADSGSLMHVILLARAASLMDVAHSRVAFADHRGIWVSEDGEPPRRVWRGSADSLSLDGDRLVWMTSAGTARRPLSRVLTMRVGT